MGEKSVYNHIHLAHILSGTKGVTLEHHTVFHKI